MARRPAASAKKTYTVDFTGVEGRVTIPEGDYTAKVKEIESKEGDKAPYLAWKFEVVGPQHAGAVLYYNTSFAPNSLWNLRSLLETLGVEVPNGPLEIDPTELADLEVGVVVVHEEYEGKKRSKIADFFVAEDAPEDEPKPSAKTLGKAAAKLEKIKADDVAEMTEDELEDLVTKYKLGIDLDEQKSLRKKQNVVLDALESKGFLEE